MYAPLLDRPLSAPMARTDLLALRRRLDVTGGRLGELVARSRALRRLDAALARVLGAALAAHVHAASLAGGRLVVLADSPAWASRVRYLGAGVAAALCERHFDVREVRVLTRPPSAAPVPPAPRRARIGPGAAALLRAVARDIEDPALRAALERLASRR